MSLKFLIYFYLRSAHENVIVGQSGGPTAVINASLYGVIREALAHEGQIGHIYGMVNGIEGFCRISIWILVRSFQRRSWSF